MIRSSPRKRGPRFCRYTGFPLAREERGERASRREIAEPLEVGPLLCATRRQLEQAGRVAPENIVLGLLGEGPQGAKSAPAPRNPNGGIPRVGERRRRRAAV